jgi:O-acetyl-ADP-ribose deacetylase (regulator of RNase III)
VTLSGMAKHAGARIEVVVGDLTKQDVDAVVNAANSTLRGGGGVDGAIHAAAGPRLREECNRIRDTTHPEGLPVGEAVVTGAGDLGARWVVHTVGPNRRRGQSDPALLAAAFTSALRAAAGAGARSVAFPAISAGAFGWEMSDVAAIAVGAVREVLAAGDAPDVAEVRFVLVDDKSAAAFRHAIAGMPPEWA